MDFAILMMSFNLQKLHNKTSKDHRKGKRTTKSATNRLTCLIFIFPLKKNLNPELSEIKIVACLRVSTKKRRMCRTFDTPPLFRIFKMDTGVFFTGCPETSLLWLLS
jgi:hypothetical protein